MKTNYLLIGLLAVTTSLQADIYKWTDSDGNVHFSDKQHQDAEIIKLPPIQVYSPQPQNEQPAQNSNQNPVRAIEYSSIQFNQPVDQATIWSNQGNFPINLDIEPELAPNDTLQLLLDGEPIGKPQNSTSFQLTGVNRGSHTLQAQILNAQGEVLKSSETITIFLHRAIKGQATRR